MTKKSIGFFSNKANREKSILNRINFVLDWGQINDEFILDDGAGAGKIAQGLSNRGVVIGIDLIRNFPKKSEANRTFRFINAVGEYLPFKPKIFSGIISQMVLEHVKNIENYLQEIYYVLKQNGLVYLAFPNRMFPIEPHTKIPLISYLPHNFFQRIVNMKIGRNYPLKFLTYKILKEISAIGFKEVRDLVPYLLKRRNQFYPQVPSFVCRFLARTYRILRYFIPTWIWVLRKN